MKNNPLLELGNLFLKIQATDLKHRQINLEKAIGQACEVTLRQNKKGNKVMIVGNGGSASIASHIATDFVKNLSIPALSFSDSSLLTCLSNDLGYEKVFSAPIGVLAKKGDILFAISSSGKSRNILNAVSEGKKAGCFVISLSGFSANNPLRRSGNINFYAPSLSYGDVEIAHLALCHSIVDILCGIRRHNFPNR
ncbi:MAG: SIS domain-containing protein [Candidatus Omnitrophica bacterium]|nr:SIS domain-containing protein [Candidatus Omnitrophota bacterium]